MPGRSQTHNLNRLDERGFNFLLPPHSSRARDTPIVETVGELKPLIGLFEIEDGPRLVYRGMIRQTSANLQSLMPIAEHFLFFFSNIMQGRHGKLSKLLDKSEKKWNARIKMVARRLKQ